MPIKELFTNREEYNAWYRNYRRKNAEKMRAYNRKYNKEWRKKNGYAAEARYKLRHPKKILAQRKVTDFIRYWKIKRGNCFCGIRGQAHHPNYNYPLRIVWLCSLHHRQVHTGTLRMALNLVDLRTLIPEKLSTQNT